MRGASHAVFYPDTLPQGATYAGGFTDHPPPSFFGETREVRIREYLEVNPEMIVVGLPDGTGLRVEDGEIEVFGRDGPLRIFRRGVDVYETRDAEVLAAFL